MNDVILLEYAYRNAWMAQVPEIRGGLLGMLGIKTNVRCDECGKRIVGRATFQLGSHDSNDSRPLNIPDEIKCIDCVPLCKNCEHPIRGWNGKWFHEHEVDDDSMCGFGHCICKKAVSDLKPPTCKKCVKCKNLKLTKDLIDGFCVICNGYYHEVKS